MMRCWWNPFTHIYAPVTAEDKVQHSLERLDDTAAAISRVCGLDLFSTEIALSQQDEFLVVDYINDQIDLRLQSVTQEGVPDVIVREIAERLVRQLVEKF